MVVEDVSILSPVKTERTMASDSPARSLDEIDLSALRVSAPRGVRVHTLSVCLSFRPHVSRSFPLVSTRLYRAVLTDDCACVHVSFGLCARAVLRVLVDR